ncbi:MAG: hypothetical protein ACI8QF_003165, partial [Limisphaerales bacterium]
LPNRHHAAKQESAHHPKESKMPVGRESLEPISKLLKGRQSRHNPFGILKWARGDSRPIGIGSLPLFEVPASTPVYGRPNHERHARRHYGSNSKYSASSGTVNPSSAILVSPVFRKLPSKVSARFTCLFFSLSFSFAFTTFHGSPEQPRDKTRRSLSNCAP